MRFSTSLIVAFISAGGLVSAYSSGYSQFARRAAAPSYYDDNLDIYARGYDSDLYVRDYDDLDVYARDVDEFELFGRDFDDSDLIQLGRRTLEEAKKKVALDLVKNHQAKAGQDARAKGDMRTVMQTGMVRQKIDQVYGNDPVAAARPAPQNFAQAQSQSHSRAWGEDSRGGHRGGGAPSNMRTGF